MISRRVFLNAAGAALLTAPITRGEQPRSGRRKMARSKAIRQRAAQIREELGNPATIVLGVDRLDYTKGIDVRLRALGELYADGRITADNVVMVQLATPSRERVEHYQRMRNDIEQAVGRINGEFGRVGHPAVHYLHQSVPREELIAFYVAADVMLVTPVRDGMNLVAKEYVACKQGNHGVLLLSEFAGAAAEMGEALQINPYDEERSAEALVRAMEMPQDEQRQRMMAMYHRLLRNDVFAWGERFIEGLKTG